MKNSQNLKCPSSTITLLWVRLFWFYAPHMYSTCFSRNHSHMHEPFFSSFRKFGGGFALPLGILSASLFVEYITFRYTYSKDRYENYMICLEINPREYRYTRGNVHTHTHTHTHTHMCAQKNGFSRIHRVCSTCVLRCQRNTIMYGAAQAQFFFFVRSCSLSLAIVVVASISSGGQYLQFNNVLNTLIIWY
jgi:hypothetical protein